MERRGKRAEHNNTDRWLVSYADFITLLFAFFVVMYSISSVNEAKYKIFSDSLNIAFSQRLPITTPIAPVNQPLVQPTQQRTQPPSIVPGRNKILVDKHTAQLGEQQRKIEERMKKLASGLRQVMAPMIEQRMVNINQTKRGVVMDISESTLFNIGEANLQDRSLDVLRQVSTILGKEDMPIEVEGHTDDIPITTAQFPSNWELSSARASSVVRVLIENGMPAKRLTAVGLASNQPLAPNNSAENRARNRRVTITIVSPNLDRETGSE
ncbi:MAG: flagellar motor protein MotD [Gallionella sp.]|nr:flagellar motor protein MotD [Gallionella sp.]